jgi:hypothetical protein
MSELVAGASAPIGRSGPGAGDEDYSALRFRAWDQAWEHSRHLETLRGQYLGFFFAAVLGALAITSGDLASQDPASSGSSAFAAGVALVLQVLAASLLFAVRRLGGVMQHYEAVRAEIRDEVFDALPAGTNRPLWLGRAPEGKSRGTTTQGAAENLLEGAVLVLLALLVAATAGTLLADDSSLLASVASCLLLGAGAFVGLFVRPFARGRIGAA